MFKKFLIFFLFSANLLFSQEIRFKNMRPEISTLDVEASLIYQFVVDSITVIDLESFKVIERKKIKHTKETPFLSFEPVWLKNKLLLSKKNGGELYEILADSLVRVDRSNIYYWQSNSSLFVKKDSIFKYGGYGYWTTTNALTYFDNTSKGWEIVVYNEESELPLSTHHQNHFVTEESLYIFNGFHIIEQNRIKNAKLNDLWRLDFPSKRWSYLGEVNEMLREEYYSVISSKGDDFELFNKNYGLARIDIKNNKAFLFKKNPLYFNVTQEGKLKIFKHKGYYYHYTVDNLDVVLKKVSEEAFVKQNTSVIPFYVNKKLKTRIYFILFGLLLLGAVIWWRIKKRKKKQKTLFIYPNKIAFNLKEHYLEGVEFEILKTIIKGKNIESSDILSLVYNESLTKSHNEKVKTQTLEGLNLKLSYILGSQQTYIVSDKSLEDKRIRVYSLQLGKILVKMMS